MEVVGRAFKVKELQSKLERLKRKRKPKLEEEELLRKRLKLEIRSLPIPEKVKGWAMTNNDEELEKGWRTFVVPINEEERERPRREAAIKSVASTAFAAADDSDYNSEDLDIDFMDRPNKRPQKKTDEQLLNEAKRLLHILSKTHKISWPFQDPVDAEGLNIPDYRKIVKRPMDLGTIYTKLKEGRYNENIHDFVRDVRLVFTNATLFNEPRDEIYRLAIQCSNLFELKLEKSKISAPMPLGLSRSPRWKVPLAWRRAKVEEVIVWNAKDYEKDVDLARNFLKR
mmetsp:Transcript_13731/g.25899  ORF Transcript_13731/g.25899 Transcript_13731/m.25899 type:complete len:284 (-) Transcript_13731:15-866(-)